MRGNPAAITPASGRDEAKGPDMSLNDDDISTTSGGGPEGPADSGAGEGTPGQHDGGADGGADSGAEGPADSGAGEGTPGQHDGGADGGADSGAR